MLHFIHSLPKKLFGKRKKNSTAASPTPADEIGISVDNHHPEAEPSPIAAPAKKPEDAQQKAVSFSEEPPRVRRTKNTAFTRRPKTPAPSTEQNVQAEKVEKQDLQAMYSKIETHTTALQEEHPSSDAAPVVATKEAPANSEAPHDAKVSMKDEIVRKAKEHRHRTHTHNQYYKSKGKDTYNLAGRELKSVFEDDAGEKLPVAERQKILRELQKGTRKHHFR